MYFLNRFYQKIHEYFFQETIQILFYENVIQLKILLLFNLIKFIIKLFWLKNMKPI